MSKWVWTILVALVMALAVACGGSSQGSGSAASSSALVGTWEGDCNHFPVYMKTLEVHSDGSAVADSTVLSYKVLGGDRVQFNAQTAFVAEYTRSGDFLTLSRIGEQDGCVFARKDSKPEKILVGKWVSNGCTVQTYADNGTTLFATQLEISQDGSMTARDSGGRSGTKRYSMFWLGNDEFNAMENGYPDLRLKVRKDTLVVAGLAACTFGKAA